MPFKPNLSDWCAAGFWLTVLVLLPVLFDLVLCPMLKVNTVSWTTYRWCVRWPWLAWVGLAVALGLWWHVCHSCWPCGGD